MCSRLQTPPRLAHPLLTGILSWRGLGATSGRRRGWAGASVPAAGVPLPAAAGVTLPTVGVLLPTAGEGRAAVVVFCLLLGELVGGASTSSSAAWSDAGGGMGGVGVGWGRRWRIRGTRGFICGGISAAWCYLRSAGCTATDKRLLPRLAQSWLTGICRARLAWRRWATEHWPHALSEVETGVVDMLS